MVKDWFSHGTSPKDRPWKFPREPDDAAAAEDRSRSCVCRPIPAASACRPRYRHLHQHRSHWWDASQIYGVTPAQQNQVRSREGGKFRIDPDGLPPYPTDPTQNPALVPGFWLGLAMMGILFVREHNAICDRLQADYPHWPDEELFQRARLINAALIAKIHTVEWTPRSSAIPRRRPRCAPTGGASRRSDSPARSGG